LGMDTALGQARAAGLRHILTIHCAVKCMAGKSYDPR
jgi:hypothetical protein